MVLPPPPGPNARRTTVYFLFFKQARVLPHLQVPGVLHVDGYRLGAFLGRVEQQRGQGLRRGAGGRAGGRGESSAPAAGGGSADNAIPANRPSSIKNQAQPMPQHLNAHHPQRCCRHHDSDCAPRRRPGRRARCRPCPPWPAPASPRPPARRPAARTRAPAAGSSRTRGRTPRAGRPWWGP